MYRYTGVFPGGVSAGPLKLSLMLYHTLICLWSTVGLYKLKYKLN